jgi:hypothetical protein
MVIQKVQGKNVLNARWYSVDNFDAHAAGSAGDDATSRIFVSGI